MDPCPDLGRLERDNHLGALFARRKPLTLQPAHRIAANPAEEDGKPPQSKRHLRDIATLTLPGKHDLARQLDRLCRKIKPVGKLACAFCSTKVFWDAATSDPSVSNSLVEAL
ncbi:MAG TPA: hypothetical protein VL147_11695 [Devosia sp.]|nr:hypothetical protein [Devosia sp.]